MELRASMSRPGGSTPGDPPSGDPSSGDSPPGGAEAALAAQVRLLRADGGPVDPQLALFAADHGDPAVAVELMRGEWKHTRSVIAADALAWALHRDGRDTEALEYARRAAATGWNNALFRYHRGVIEEVLGCPGPGTICARRWRPTRTFLPTMPRTRRS
ncbi:hypothetical protein NKH18_24305 [Streptomyces sp. M10(2022)]